MIVLQRNHRARDIRMTQPTIRLTVNGASHDVRDAWIGESLLYVLRERLGLPGAKGACEQGARQLQRHFRRAFQVFEIGHLMNLGEQNLVPILLYLFHRVERRLREERPSLLIVEEAWIAASSTPCSTMPKPRWR